MLDYGSLLHPLQLSIMACKMGNLCSYLICIIPLVIQELNNLQHVQINGECSFPILIHIVRLELQLTFGKKYDKGGTKWFTVLFSMQIRHTYEKHCIFILDHSLETIPQIFDQVAFYLCNIHKTYSAKKSRRMICWNMLQFTLNECDDVPVTRAKTFYIALFSLIINHDLSAIWKFVIRTINPPFYYKHI